MISIFEGRIGGGKTLLAVTRILAHLSAGGTVLSNVELKWPACVEYCKKNYGVIIREEQFIRLSEEQTGQFHKHCVGGTRELPVLCVLDEIHLWFNARDSSLTASTKRSLLIMVSQSRKLHVDIVFIAQNAADIEGQFRSKAAELWRMRDIRAIVVPFLGLRWPWEDILAFRLDYATGLCMQRKMIRRTKEIFDCYETDSLLRPVEFAGEVRSVFKLERASTQKAKFDIEKLPFRYQVGCAALIGLLLQYIIYG